MLLESIKDVTKDGRIVVKDADYSGRTLYVFKLGSTFKGKLHNDRTVFPVVSLPTKEEINKWAKENNFSEVRFMDSKDSQYTKSEYAEMLARLQRQLQQAKSLGDTEEAKELQKEIDDLKALESGVQDKSTKDSHIGYATYKGKKISWDKRTISYKEVIRFIDSNDTEAKITDLTEKAKAARAQGYAADQYEAEIEKLKALDKKNNDAYDEVDWLTLDPLTEKGKEILASMKKEYGDERGEKIFYASKNAGKITGVDSVKDARMDKHEIEQEIEMYEHDIATEQGEDKPDKDFIEECKYQIKRLKERLNQLRN